MAIRDLEESVGFVAHQSPEQLAESLRQHHPLHRTQTARKRASGTAPIRRP
ncbi:MAG UNVERIFIED_CONTAM: hypothetical protein LVR18_09000 [Planctomycetaceae bacterium]